MDIRQKELFDEWSPMAEELAKAYEGSSLPGEDLAQEAMLGLLEAISALGEDREMWPYDLEEFFTEAVNTRLAEASAEEDNAIAEEEKIVRGVESLSAAIDSLTEKLGTKPNIDELADELSVTQDEVLRLLRMTGDEFDDENLASPLSEEEELESVWRLTGEGYDK